MDMNERSEKMKNCILINNIFTVIQLILVFLSVIFNYFFDDTAVFMVVFIHVGLFVIYNGIIESFIEYGFLRKKYSKICSETPYWKHLKLKKRMYKAAKNNNDSVSKRLIEQNVIKCFTVILNVIFLLFAVSFE